MALFLREAEVGQLLPLPDAISSVEDAFGMLGSGEAVDHPRGRAQADGAVLNAMWAIAPTLGAMGIKSYPIVRSDVTQSSTSTFVLYGLPEGRLEAILEADTLGQRRTGAASAVATRRLARPESRVLTVFGAGWQAESQVAALARVLPNLERVLVVGRSEERRDRFVAKMGEALGVGVEAAEAEEAVRAADVLVTITGSADPLFDGAWLKPGAHINAAGSNFAGKRELDATTLQRADLVVADSSEVARLESGDLISNGFDWGRLHELGAVVVGAAPDDARKGRSPCSSRTGSPWRTWSAPRRC
ncbi:ornithine cyclodeaminase family protein [Rubrobacter marinus]|uniref:Ornithine cyclodeaminase family protein n=1 Tax=Rubrobacter marinus TaxID=2653852 RepID=A0A6G8PWB5_9ACTN|nr:ornithine cyclodeaminase family protein [Rubrobacter marinus]QIN78502.1 ornithine cyclodeaminase family protein [Rubrobacter marinus]